MHEQKRPRVQLIEESDYGVYVWKTPTGQWVGDDEGNYLSIASKKNDPEKIKKLTEAVRYYGVVGGSPVFLSGHRKIDDEEFEHQKARQAAGLVPDPFDVGAMKEELRDRRFRK